MGTQQPWWVIPSPNIQFTPGLRTPRVNTLPQAGGDNDPEMEEYKRLIALIYNGITLSETEQDTYLELHKKYGDKPLPTPTPTPIPTPTGSNGPLNLGPLTPEEYLEYFRIKGKFDAYKKFDGAPLTPEETAKLAQYEYRVANEETTYKREQDVYKRQQSEQATAYQREKDARDYAEKHGLPPVPLTNPREMTSIFGQKPGDYGYEAAVARSNIRQGVPGDYGEPPKTKKFTDKNGTLWEKDIETGDWKIAIQGKEEQKTLQELEALYGPTVYDDVYDPEIGQMVRKPRFAFNATVPHPGKIEYRTAPDEDTITGTQDVPGRPGWKVSVNKYGRQVDEPFQEQRKPISERFNETVRDSSGNLRTVTYQWMQMPDGTNVKFNVTEGKPELWTQQTVEQLEKTTTAQKLGYGSQAGAQLTDVQRPGVYPPGSPINVRGTLNQVTGQYENPVTDFSQLGKIGDQWYGPQDIQTFNETKKQSDAALTASAQAYNISNAARNAELDAQRRRSGLAGRPPAWQR